MLGLSLALELSKGRQKEKIRAQAIYEQWALPLDIVEGREKDHFERKVGAKDVEAERMFAWKRDEIYRS